MDRTGASISAGITPIVPGFLSNVSPSPPASSWVSLEGEEQENQNSSWSGELALLHPWADQVVGPYMHANP